MEYGRLRNSAFSSSICYLNVRLLQPYLSRAGAAMLVTKW